MHVSCLHSHVGTRWPQTRNVSLMIMIKPQCLWAHWNSDIFHHIRTLRHVFSHNHTTRHVTSFKDDVVTKLWPIRAADTPQSLCVWLLHFLFGQSHACKQRQTVQHGSILHAVHMPLSPEAWECTLSSLSLWWRLWCVADPAPASSGWDVSSFSDGREEVARREWKRSS